MKIKTNKINRVTIVYEGALNAEFDELLGSLMVSIGFKYVGSGYLFSETKRDLVYKRNNENN